MEHGQALSRGAGARRRPRRADALYRARRGDPLPVRRGVRRQADGRSGVDRLPAPSREGGAGRRACPSHPCLGPQRPGAALPEAGGAERGDGARLLPRRVQPCDPEGPDAGVVPGDRRRPLPQGGHPPAGSPGLGDLGRNAGPGPRAGPDSLCARRRHPGKRCHARAPGARGHGALPLLRAGPRLRCPLRPRHPLLVVFPHKHDWLFCGAPPLYTLPDMSAPSADERYTTGILIRRLTRLAWQFPGDFLLSLTLSVSLLALGLVGLQLLGLVIDVIRHALDPALPAPVFPLGWRPPEAWTALNTVTALSFILAAQALIRAVLAYAYTMVTARLTQGRIVPDLRSRLYARLQHLSFSFFDRHGSHSIFNRVTGDVQNTRLFVDGVLLQGGETLLTLFAYAVFMWKVHPALTAACLSVAFPLAGLTRYYSERLRPGYLRNRELSDNLVLLLGESVKGMQTVKGFSAEAQQVRRFEEGNRQVSSQQRRIFWDLSLFAPSTQLLSQLSLAAARRVFEVLDTEPEVRSRPGALVPPRLQGRITFENVSFGYGSGPAVLDGITLDAQPGQVIGIFGLTGAGKSSLLSLIPRLYDPRQGRIFADGIDLKDLDLDACRRQIGIVYQETFLFSNTVAANIAFGHYKATLDQIRAAAKLASADEFISALPQGYDTVLGESGVDLSGGQRQRIALARALLLQPPILILDDPTASVDAKTENEIGSALREAMAGRTTFVVSGRLSLLRRADLILVLESGRLTQTGTHEQLAHRPGPYRETALLQMMDLDGPEGRVA